jgi:hypothetical protein
VASKALLSEVLFAFLPKSKQNGTAKAIKTEPIVTTRWTTAAMTAEMKIRLLIPLPDNSPRGSLCLLAV